MTRAAPARRAAYAALRAVTSAQADLPDALARARGHLADERDQALAAEIATGTLRWMGALDAIIEACGSRPIGRLDPEVLDILRLSVYQIRHLDRVPARAVVNDAVDLVREARKQSASSFVNALLRRVLREMDGLPLPRKPLPGDGVEAALDYLSVTLSHPRWLVARWVARAGFDAAEAWARFDNAPAPLTLRVNTLALTREDLVARLAAHGVSVSATRFSPDGLVVTGGNPFRTPLIEEGACVVQDEASQLVAMVADARPGERVLDACASPGGKTLAMAAAMQNEGLIVAGDVRSRRIALLTQAVARSGARRVRLARLDAAALPFGASFDLVLLDAPCSGLGTIRRDPEIRWRRREAELPVLAAAQARMLERAATAVRPGGRIVYATCSSEPEENERLVAAFLDAHPEFEIESPARRADVPPAVGALIDPAGCFRSWPYAHGLEAFFAVVLRSRQALVNRKPL
jgi:16S rRNA (cytosine967-C5)-methyltransferase